MVEPFAIRCTPIKPQHGFIGIWGRRFLPARLHHLANDLMWEPVRQMCRPSRLPRECELFREMTISHFLNEPDVGSGVGQVPSRRVAEPVRRGAV
jgi:hypothetical protein